MRGGESVTASAPLPIFHRKADLDACAKAPDAWPSSVGTISAQLSTDWCLGRDGGVAFRALVSTARMKLRLVVTLAFLLVLAVPSTAAARVRLVSVTSPIGAGSYARLTASVSPSRTCSITVHYKSGPSHAAGLYAKRPVGGRVSWTWKVGTRTTPGRWPIVVSCGSAGTLRTSFVVR